MDNARRAAYHALRDVEENKAYSGFAVQNAIDKFAPDRISFVRELVYGTIRMQLYLDNYIESFIKTPMHKLPVSDRVLLRMGLYQHLSLNSVPDYASVSETVELAKRYARGREKFINGVLRQCIREKDAMKIPSREDDCIGHLSVKYSFEPWIVKMWIEDFSSTERVESLLNALNQKPHFCIRVNTLKTEPEELKKQFAGLGFGVEEDEDLPDLLFLEEFGKEQPLATNLYKRGLFSVQDKSSRIAAASLGAKEDEKIIDVCAAPGGKTMAIAEEMKNSGKILAMDINEQRLELVSEQAKRLGIKNVETMLWDGMDICDKFRDSADRVLVDAPCSGFGTARSKPEVKYRKFNDTMKALPGRQLDILKVSAHYVKPGGILVYSTCTIAKRENEDVINAFTQANNEYKMVDMIQLLPMTGQTDGFFVCKLERKGPH